MQNSRTHSWRFSRLRTARGGQPVRPRCLCQNSCPARHSDCLRRAHWSHRALYTHDSAWRSCTPKCGRPRRARNPRTGGHRMSRVQLNNVSPLKAQHIHVIGIGGSAMAPLAGMLRESGYRVTGSGSGVYTRASTLLDSLGIAFYNTFDAAHMKPAPDLVIVGNIIARGNPELEEVLDCKIPYRSLPEILEEVFLPGRHSIVVSGTHGKTTTTAMLAWIFHSAGRKPNFLVGGV